MNLSLQPWTSATINNHEIRAYYFVMILIHFSSGKFLRESKSTMEIRMKPEHMLESYIGISLLRKKEYIEEIINEIRKMILNL